MSQNPEPYRSNLPPLHAGDPPTTSEERLLAGLAHLGIFGGMWLVAPIVVYFYKGKASRFVGFHAVQAILLNVAAVPLSIAGVIFAFGGTIVGAAVLQDHAADPVLAMALPLFFIVALFGASLGWLIVTIVAGVRALDGRAWSIPIIGRLAHRVVRDG